LHLDPMQQELIVHLNNALLAPEGPMNAISALILQECSCIRWSNYHGTTSRCYIRGTCCCHYWYHKEVETMKIITELSYHFALFNKVTGLTLGLIFCFWHCTSHFMVWASQIPTCFIDSILSI
jgi:hypothetical protein